MVVKKKNFTDSLAELLPDGLNETIVTKIAELVKEKVNETIKVKMESLTDQVRVFMRGNIDKLKEQAVKELELENPTFRDAQMFQSVKAMFAVENTNADEKTAINSLTESAGEQENKISVLVSEVDRLVKENLNLKRNTKVLTDHNSKLNESVQKLKEVKESNSGKIMSDRALIVTAANFKASDNGKEGAKKTVSNGNEWLNESVIEAGKKLGIGTKK